ncbi:hypothetical protein Ddye_017324 [Dipteronia dyeriana]|uniref:3'-5' exonuclease domain-containing protein n=1 Tax=Dipteronia dyeriana TaxID=168575 RepID=A0AAD9U8G6_9ROSI|nr:hypothetical protein Ddye_017324 [Dipteronia dyeriana]
MSTMEGKRPLNITDEDWPPKRAEIIFRENIAQFNKDQIECATVDAYAAYKIAKSYKLIIRMAEPEVLMAGGMTVLRPEVIYSVSDGRRCLAQFLERMYDHGGDMIVGFDTEWTSYYRGSEETIRVRLLKFCNQDCVVLLDFAAYGYYVNHFFANDDIVFAGVHLNKNLEMLRKTWGSTIDIRNAVDLSEMAADVLHQPRLTAFGVRSLATEVLGQPWKPRPYTLSMTCDPWSGTLGYEKIECATIDAYATYMIAKKPKVSGFDLDFCFRLGKDNPLSMGAKRIIGFDRVIIYTKWSYVSGKDGQCICCCSYTKRPWQTAKALKQYGFEVQNYMDLSELDAKDMPGEVFQPNWNQFICLSGNLSLMECATADVYVAYKIAKELPRKN